MTVNLPKHVKYWLSEAKHDCFFLVGPELGPTERIGAMKTLLTGFSEPLRAMLQDSKLAEPGDIRIIDVDPETFHNFLKCVYGGSGVVIPKLSFEETVKLLYVTEKYLVEDLKAEIETHLDNIRNPDKIFFALSYPFCFTVPSLQQDMVKTVQKGFLEITMDQKFLNLSKDAVTWILQQNILNVKEVEIWTAILKWAQHQAKSSNGEVLRSKVFPFLKYIRFLAMDCKDFCGNVVPSGILLKEETDEILLSHNTGNIPSIVHLCQSKKHRYEIPKGSDNIVRDSLETPNGVLIFFTINNISSLSSREFSEPVIFAGFSWQLMVGKYTSITNKEHFFSIYLVCNNYLRGWPNPFQHTCNAHVTFTLGNQTGQSDLHRPASHNFTNVENDWGYQNFCKWNMVIDPEQGFLKDNKIIVMTRINLIDSVEDTV